MKLKDREFFERQFTVRMFRGDRGWAAMVLNMAGCSRAFRSRWAWIAALKACLWALRCPAEHFTPTARGVVRVDEMPR